MTALIPQTASMPPLLLSMIMAEAIRKMRMQLQPLPLMQPQQIPNNSPPPIVRLATEQSPS